MATSNASQIALSPFGQMLRDWRRTRAQSQLSLGLAASVSARHISFLETGRAQPSRAMVLSLADALDMPLRAQNSLLESAGFAPVYSARPLDHPAQSAARSAVDLVLKAHEPYAAFVIDSLWNLVAVNEGARTMLSAFDVAYVPGQTNLAKLTCGPGVLKELTINWQQVAQHLLARIRHEARSGARREEAQQLLDEVSLFEGCNELTHRPDFEPDPILQMHLQLGDQILNLVSIITTLGTPQDVTLAELRIETFLPADDNSAEILASFLQP